MKSGSRTLRRLGTATYSPTLIYLGHLLLCPASFGCVAGAVTGNEYNQAKSADEWETVSDIRLDLSSSNRNEANALKYRVATLAFRGTRAEAGNCQKEALDRKRTNSLLELGLQRTLAELGNRFPNDTINASLQNIVRRSEQSLVGNKLRKGHLVNAIGPPYWDKSWDTKPIVRRRLSELAYLFELGSRSPTEAGRKDPRIILQAATLELLLAVWMVSEVHGRKGGDGDVAEASPYINGDDDSCNLHIADADKSLQGRFHRASVQTVLSTSLDKDTYKDCTHKSPAQNDKRGYIECPALQVRNHALSSEEFEVLGGTIRVHIYPGLLRDFLVTYDTAGDYEYEPPDDSLTRLARLAVDAPGGSTSCYLVRLHKNANGLGYSSAPQFKPYAWVMYAQTTLALMLRTLLETETYERLTETFKVESLTDLLPYQPLSSESFSDSM